MRCRRSRLLTLSILEADTDLPCTTTASRHRVEICRAHKRSSSRSHWLWGCSDTKEQRVVSENILTRYCICRGKDGRKYLRLQVHVTPLSRALGTMSHTHPIPGPDVFGSAYLGICGGLRIGGDSCMWNQVARRGSPQFRWRWAS